jgi:hypothetical protein
MAIPPTATAFPQALSPRDAVDFYVIVSQGPDDQATPPVLQMGEGIREYSLALSPEAVAAGLEIMSGADADGQIRTDKLTGNEIKLWLRVATAMQGSSIFNGVGTTFEIKALIKTTALPSRTKERTFLVRVARQ